MVTSVPRSDQLRVKLKPRFDSEDDGTLSVMNKRVLDPPKVCPIPYDSPGPSNISVHPSGCLPYN